MHRFIKRTNKYGAKKTWHNGIKFDSTLEKDFYVILTEELGLSPENIVLQPIFLLQDKFRDKNGKAIRKIEYRADFQFSYAGTEMVVDAKGMETDVYKLKYKLLIYKYPELDFFAVKSKKAFRVLLGLV